MSDDGLGVTALYTSHTWLWGGLSHAHLFATPEAKRVFDATNAAIALASVFRRDRVPLRDALMHRHAMIDRILRESKRTRVVELAAGLSRRGAAFSSDPAVHYVELDLPPMIAKKRQLLERTEEGRAVLARPNLVLREGDVRGELAVDGDIVIAEGLAMYLDGAARRGLFARVAQLAAATREVRFVFDLTPSDEEPRPGLAGRALEAAMKRFTGGRAFERDARTRAQLTGELAAAGFTAIEAVAAREVAQAWRLPCPEQATPTVVFSATARATAR